jgi:hypothetical protein
MAARGWGGSIALAVGASAGMAAAQLGVVYGLGIMAWNASTDAAGESAWLASLAWTTWIAATSTVVGAVVTDRLSSGLPGSAPPRRRSGSFTTAGAVATTAWRLVVALTAAIGGLLTVALVAVPARAAHRPETYAPQMIAGGYAVVGVAVGIVVALAAISSRAIATNVVLTTAYVWALAIAEVVFGVASRQGLSTAQLDVWRFGDQHFLRQTFSVPGAGLMLGVALVLGLLGALPAVRRGDGKVGAAVSGAVGPFLVAAAYFLAAPKLVGVQPDEQLSAYLVAPYALMAGLAGSVVLVGLAAQREQRAANRAAVASLPTAGSLSTAASLPTAEAPPVESLDEDAYAPVRAYGTASVPTPALATGAGAAPLWPDHAAAAASGDEVTQPRPAKKGRGRR